MNRHRLVRSAALAAAAAATTTAALLTSGCGVTPQRLMFGDSSKDGDVLVAIRPQAWARRDAAGPGRGFEAGYHQDGASGTQALNSGETVFVRNGQINGPDTLLQTAKFVSWHFGYADRFYFGPAFELDIGAGGMRLELDYSLRPQSGVIGTRTFARDFTLGYGAITPRYRFSPYVALEARIVAAGEPAEVEQRRIDGAVVLRPVPQVALRLGYSSRKTTIETFGDGSFSSLDITVRSRGPTAGLRIDF